MSYLEITLCFLTDNSKKEDLLTDVKTRLDKLLENKKLDAIDRAELYTLIGYYYNAKITQAPSKNGPIYYKNVFENYNKALNLDPKNPRANYLLHMFEFHVNNFSGKPNNKICDKFVEDQKLFETYPLKEDNYPNWGIYNLLTLIQNCNK